MTRTVIAILLVSCASAAAETTTTNWGTLRGQFIYEGKPPKPQKLTPSRRPGKFDADPLYDQSLVVNEKNRGVANIVIWLYRKRNEPLPKSKIHPSFEAKKEDTVKITATPREFTPRMIPLRSGQSLLPVNDDTVGHNFKIDSINEAYNVLVPAGQPLRKPLRFAEPESLPFRVSSSIYIWIDGYILVQDHPYTAITDENGRFKIENLPAGTWTFRVWHERVGFVRQVVHGMTKKEWNLGRFEQEIKPGDNNLREIYLSPSQFSTEKS